MWNTGNCGYLSLYKFFKSMKFPKMGDAKTRVMSWTESVLHRKKKVVHPEVGGVFCELAGFLFDALFYLYPSYKSLRVLQEPNDTITIHLMVYWLVTAFFLLYEKYVRIYYAIGLESVRRVVSLWFIIPVAYNDLIYSIIPMVAEMAYESLAQVMTRNLLSISGYFMNPQVGAEDVANIQENLLNISEQNRNEPQSESEPPSEGETLEKS